MMIFDKARGEIRIFGRVHLALRVADQALRKHLQAEDVPWKHMNITEHHSDRVSDSKRLVCLQGVFFGDGDKQSYSGEVMVYMDLVGSVWISTDVLIYYRDELAGDTSEQELRASYLTDYATQSVESHTYDAVIPALRSGG